MDNLINSITSTSDSGITLTLPMAIVAMAVALIFGLVISLTYMGTHKNKYQQSFAITLTMLPIILTVIILFVGSNVARAFSLAGTLSIIRFRSSLGDPEDIGYISKIKFGKPNTTAKNLKITIPENLDYEGIFDEIIKKYSKDYTLQKVRTTDLGSLYELTYSVNMNKDADEKKFIDELRCRNGNLNIVLSLAATEFYGK